MSDSEAEFFLNLIKDKEKLENITDQRLADLVAVEVYADLPLSSKKTSIIEEVIRRLRS